MNTKLFTLLIFALFTHYNAYCVVEPIGFTIHDQNIVVKGKVMDAGDSSALAGATVFIRELGLETLSNDEGIFTFNALPNIRITITVEYGQYLPVEISVNNPAAPVNIYMKRNSVALREVIVIGIEDNKSGITSTRINRKAHRTSAGYEFAGSFATGAWRRCY